MIRKAPRYITRYGAAYLGDALALLDELETDSVDLVVTSPPFALQREKAYGNVDQHAYVDWLLAFCRKVFRVLAPHGSFVLDLGGAYQRRRPVRSLYPYEVLLRLCRELEFRLAEEFFWYNPAKLPSPIEWVNKQKIRVKDAVNHIWWLAKDDFPKADVRRVLVPYSSRMRKLQADPEKFYTPALRPSGHEIGERFATDNGGAIPSNLLHIPNTESSSLYLQRCKALGISPHPARFPVKLPLFFIQFLTEPGDVVLDIFAGSNTTGFAAECLRRRWIAFELEPQYLAASALRFLPRDVPEDEVATLYQRLLHTEQGSTIVLPHPEVEQAPLFDV
uniref:Methyltransferase n=1 Tax=Thermogemmatispora argillosa TaxID=2045280 RepID=A0A455SYL9_9CHLR|nr:methyltransferase [Thermogemmatispora argillosa]